MVDFKYKIQLRYPDFDTQHFVNHSKICTYIESAYVSFLTDCIKTGWTYSNLPILLKSEATDFLKPITASSKPLCKLVVKEIRNKGIRIQVEIIDEIEPERKYTIAERILIHVDLASAQPLYFSKTTVEQLKQYLDQSD